MAGEVLYTRFDPEQDTDQVEALVACYQRVFATLPWSEWKQCPTCGTKWGLEQEAELAALGFVHHGAPVIDFWGAERVREDMRREITQRSSCWFAWSGGSIVGFCWGYIISPHELEAKLELPGLASALKRFGFRDNLVGFQDELGVEESYRGMGVASELFRRRLADFRGAQVSVTVVRTKTLPPTVTFAWFNRLRYTEVKRYSDDIDGKVVMARRIEHFNL